MKTKEKTNSDARIEIRVWKDDKVEFMAKADKLGLTLTELIILLLKGNAIPDRKNQKQLYQHLSSITKEMNLIGKNINQLTTAIHQINNNNKMQTDEFKALTTVLKKIYWPKRGAQTITWKNCFLMKMNFKILKPSATFHGVGYSERKQKKGDAALIHFDNFGHLQDGRTSITKKEAEDYLTKYSRRNKWIKKPQFHAVITCKGQQFTDDQLKEHALKVMEELGYADIPILMYSHSDTENKHVHIVTSRVAQDGKKIAHDMEGARANRILSRLLNNDPVENLNNDLEDALSYNFSTVAQFYLLMENKEYDIKEIGDKVHFYKHGQQQGEIEKKSVV